MSRPKKDTAKGATGKPEVTIEEAKPSQIWDFYEEVLCEDDDERSKLIKENNKRFADDPNLEKNRNFANAIMYTNHLAKRGDLDFTQDEVKVAFGMLSVGECGFNAYEQENTAKLVRAQFSPQVAHQMKLMVAHAKQRNANRAANAIKYFGDKGINLSMAGDLLKLEQLSQLSQNKADEMMSRAHYDADVREAVCLLKGIEN